ncbi:MAG: hypothetical protein ACJ75B_15515 [Flavisolibacter sp.]
MKYLAFLILFTIAGFTSNAKIWRINNTPGVSADFISPQAAVSSSSVVNGDTLYIEGSAINYSGFTLDKRLVIIGTGYFLTGLNGNTGLQANPYTSNFASGAVFFDSTASGSVFMGLDDVFFAVGPDFGSATDNITITRCYINTLSQYYGYTANTSMDGWKINKCYISNVALGPLVIKNWELTNNIVIGNFDISNTAGFNNLIRNNVFRSGITIYSAYFSNNTITAATFSTINVTVKNNISTGANLPVGNGNINNSTDGALFQGAAGNSTDGQWRLKVGSPALGAGETIATITPDCGAYGTADPYRLSGIPAIPTIYSLTVPASVPSNATTMPITISTKSNN